MRVYYLIIRGEDGHIMEVLCPFRGFSVIPLPLIIDANNFYLILFDKRVKM
jgi:hypothetical protein